MKKFNRRYTSVALSIAAMTTFAAVNTANAQEAAAQPAEEQLVIGTRAVIQSSIDQKRVSTQIVDGLSADEIGDIPALSIGEALETITGASAHRENGGATEVSIRGLGPFLTNTVINGREATNGAGNRAVNFSIFPSELFNKIGIFKTQSASFIEGAVGGQIRLDTKRPIEHGKQSIQVSLKGAYNDQEQDVRGGQDIGYRGTISYIDQFETENLGTFGISLGVQIRDETNPEQEYTRSNTPRVCNLDNGIPDSTTCQDDQFELRAPGLTDEERESAFLSSAAQFRQNQTEDERNSFFGAFQWQPNDALDINLDVQWSERIQTEQRSDLVFAEINRNINESNTVIANNTLLSFQNNSALNGAGQENNGQEIQLIGQDFVRDEEYQGIGLNVEYQVNDDLKVSFDASYSNTFRVEDEESLRFGDEVERVVGAEFATNGVGVFSALNTSTNFSTPTGVFDASNLGEFLRGATENGVGSTAQDFLDAFAEDADFDDRLRARAQQDIRENTVTALRADFELQTENLGFIKSIEGGVRFSDLEYERKGNINSDLNLTALTGGSQLQADTLAAIANNCVEAPIVTSFEEVSGSQNEQFLNFNAINAGCSLDLFRAALIADGQDVDQLTPNNTFNGSSVDVDESTFAAYLQANYESELLGFPVRGNFGVRVVNTTVDSRTFIAPFLLDFNDGGGGTFELDSPTNFNSGALLGELDGNTFLDTNTESHSYTEILPSATLVVDLAEDVILRAGIFRGISRSDPAILGSRQQVGTVQRNIDDTASLGAENLTLSDIQNFITTQGLSGGAADLDAFTSWNVDLALEWYPNEDTILAAGAYYKKFRGGYENVFVDSEFTIISDGSTDSDDVLTQNISGEFGTTDSFTVTAPISSLRTTSEQSNLYGIEVTASHSFNYLPGFLSGFGAKLSYNYASSDFDFEDDFAGAGIGADGGELVGLIPSADIFGLSRNVASAQLYWSGGPFDAQVIFKHRSKYFQQFTDTPGRIRFVDDNSVVEFRASYRLNDAIKFSFEALNITDEPRIDFRGVDGNVSQVLSFGPRYFFGVKAKL